MIAVPTGFRRAAYLRAEVRVSIAVNAALSLVFFLAVFGLPHAVPIGGIGNYAFDFVPQSVMIGLMSTLVPGAITRHRIGIGRIDGVGESVGALVLRSLLMAIACAVGGGLLAVALEVLCGQATLAIGPAVAGKILYGAVLAAIVTPLGLRRALRTTALC